MPRGMYLLVLWFLCKPTGKLFTAVNLPNSEPERAQTQASALLIIKSCHR